MHMMWSAFEIARGIGMHGLRLLATVDSSEARIQAFTQQAEQETQEEVYQKARSIWQDVHAEEIAQRHALIAICTLFQSSMEAMVNVAAEHEPEIAAAIKGKGSFRDRWTAALEAIGASAHEFEDYHVRIYRGVRIPATHLDSPERVKQLEKITPISASRADHAHGMRQKASR